MSTPIQTFDEDFAAFWAGYPKRIGKLAAHKAYAKVRRGGIPHEELMDGIVQYIATKPVWQAWAHPTTWLNQGRWMDEVRPKPVLFVCSHDLSCPNAFSHDQLVQAEAHGDPVIIDAMRRLYAKKRPA